MDLLPALGTIINWILYVGLALSVVLLIIALALASFGRYSSKLFFSAFAGILIGSTATLIQNALVQGISIGDPYTLIAILIVSGFIVASVLSFGLGNPENGARYFFAAAIAAGFFAAIPAIQAVFGAQMDLPTGACTLEVKPLTQNENAFGVVNLAFTLTQGNGSYDLAVYWGDGKTDRTTISAGQSVSLTHQYSEEGGYGIVALARSKEGGLCAATLGVNIEKKPLPWFASMFDITGTTDIVSQLVSIPYQLFYTSPEFNTKNNSDDMKAYMMVTTIAISFIGIFIVLRFASGFLSKDPTESLVDSLKDAIIVIVAILIAPFIYQIFVSMCNMVSLSAAYYADLGNPAGLSLILGLIAASVALGVFSSFFGTLGGTLAALILLASVMATIRFALIKAIIYCVPLLAVAFLFPVARGATRFFISLLIGLILAGPVAAFVLVGMGTLPGVGGIAKFFAPVIAMIAFPFVFTVVGGPGPLMAATPLARIGSGLLGSLAPKGGSNVSATSTQGRGPGPDGSGGAAGHTNVNNRSGPASNGSGETTNVNNNSGVSGETQNNSGSSGTANVNNQPTPRAEAHSDSSNVSGGSPGAIAETNADSTGRGPSASREAVLNRFLNRPDYQEYLNQRARNSQAGENAPENQPPEETRMPENTNNQNSVNNASTEHTNNQNSSDNASTEQSANGRRARIKAASRRLIDARNSIARRYNALADNPHIMKLSSDFSRGSSLVLGGRPSSNNELTRANIEAARAKKEFYEARTRMLESIERDLHLGEESNENQRNNSREGNNSRQENQGENNRRRQE